MRIFKKHMATDTVLLAVTVLVLAIIIFFPVGVRESEIITGTGENAHPVSASRTESGKEKYTIVIDAGHGGEDSGAIGVNGIYEKDINLKIAKDLEKMLRAAGCRVIMTRTEDRLMYTEEQNIKGQKKVYDLKNRLDKAQSQDNPILVSIHMNNFTSSKYKGLQVYYSKNNAESKNIADIIQKTVKERLQPDNERQTKGAGSEIYILGHAEIPAVLIECGFLSNYEECEKLSEKDYQIELSFTIFCGIMNYIEDNY